VIAPQKLNSEKFTMKFRKNKESKEDKTNGKQISGFRRMHYGFLAGALVLCTYAASNLWEMHKFDKYVIKNVEIAANVPSAAGETSSDLSMVSALKMARDGKTDKNGKLVGGLKVSRLENPAIIWKTPITSVKALEELLDKSIERSRQIGQFQESLRTGEIKPDFPQWVKNAHEKINPAIFAQELKLNSANYSEGTKAMIRALEELTKSEYGQRIANEYEALNKTVAGGTRISAKNLKEKHRSLLDTLKKAGGWRSIIRLQADDYKEAHAQVFVGYLMANLGDLDTGLKHFHRAKEIMDKYQDDKNLAIIRNTPELSQATIKGLINSSIKELTRLNEDTSRYSAGWWKRLTYYNQSIGGQSNPSIQDLSEDINGRYLSRAWWTGIVGLVSLYVAGKYGKKIRLSKQYEVKPEE
jgi:tetratricopeptide (TPR) repeat protein